MATSGYSGTPLAKKLGIKPGYKIRVYEAPTDYLDLFEDWPDHVTKVENPAIASLDFIHVFAKNRKNLESLIPEAKEYLKMNGSLWVSWPKGSSGITTDINREDVRAFVLHLGLVDVKVAAINDQWSGLKFVYRTKDR